MEIAKVAHFLFYSSTEEFSLFTKKTLLRKMVITSVGSPEFTDPIEYAEDYTEVGKSLVNLKTLLTDYCNAPNTYPTDRTRKIIKMFNRLLSKPFPDGAIYQEAEFEPTITTNLKFVNKTSPCKLCGECDKFKSNYSEYTHSKKNCPYKYFYSCIGVPMNELEDINFYRFVLTLNRSANMYMKHKVMAQRETILGFPLAIKEATLSIELDKQVQLTDLNNKLTSKNSEYDVIKKELDLFHRIMPQDTIKERQENHMMMMEEQRQLKIDAEQKIVDANEALEKLKEEQGMSEINIQMRALKMQNMKHKFKTTIAELDATIITYENRQEENTTKITNLTEELQTLKLNNTLESEGYEDMEKLNEKMYSILKQQKKIPDENCSICMECIVDECMTLKCGHQFHSSCYMGYCLSKCRDDKYKCTYKCPNCRGEAVVIKNYVSSYH